MRLETEVRVKGGLPVIVQADYVPADPCIGVYEGVENLSFHWRSGKEITQSVYQSIPQSDINNAVESLLEQLH